jgi:hypothetical protein
MTADRRSFLTALTGAAGLASLAGAQAPASRPTAGTSEWDMTWLDKFRGKHKQVFDLGSFDLSKDSPLRQPITYLSAQRMVNHLEPPDDINVFVGISHMSFPMNASDALWEKYKLGEHWKILDPQTKQPAVRNIFLGQATGQGATVRALQTRGVVFWQCNFALGAISQELSSIVGKPATEIQPDLVAGLNPGVKLIVAHTFMIGVMQERGFAYEKL